jgi:hypothetical protein
VRGLEHFVACAIALLCNSLAVAADDHRAILAGIATYDPACLANSIKSPYCERVNLEGPRDDVASMRAFLIDSGFSAKNITSMIDGAATKTTFLQALSDAQSWAGPGKFLFLYFSGHGSGPSDPSAEDLHIPDGTGALVFAKPTHGTGDVSRDQLVIGRRDLRGILRDIDSRGTTIFAIFDACFSENSIRAPNPLRMLSRREFPSADSGDPWRYSTSELAVPSRHQENTAGTWPYKRTVYYAASSSGETAADIGSKSLKLFPTVDGKPHGAFTDALLRVLQGQTGFIDRRGDHVITYAELFESADTYMRKRAYGQVPHSEPNELTSGQLAVQDQPLLGLRLTLKPVTAPDRASVRILISADVPATLRQRITDTLGVSVVTAAPEYVLQLSNDKQCCVLETAADEPIYISDHRAAVTQRIEEIVSSIELRAQIRGLQAFVDKSSNHKLDLHLMLDAGSNTASLGETIVGDKTFDLVVGANAAASLAILYVGGDGTGYVLSPAADTTGSCSMDYEIRPATATRICKFRTAAPYGLDLLDVLAFQGQVEGLRSLPRGPNSEITQATLKFLRETITRSAGASEAYERRVYTIHN